MRRIVLYPVKLLLNALVLVVTLAIIGVVVGVIKLALYEQHTQEEQLESKRAYLANISKLGNQQSEQRPNIVFVLYDDLGYGDFSFTGSRTIDTPNIDSLAQGGTVINQFYSPAPVCTP
ncbi:sulfatase-like hydrolase/transferase, partial [Litorivivens sp.]